MRFKIRRVCIWVILVQVFLITLHVIFYQNFTGLNAISTRKKDVLIFTYVRRQATNKTVDNTTIHIEYRKGKHNDKKEASDRDNPGRIFTKILQTTVTTRQIVDKTVHNISQTRKRKMMSPVRKCNDVEFDARVEENYDWQTVDNETAFVFSSYYVEKTKTIIIIGARSQHHMGYFCLFWHDNKGKHTAEQVDASVKQLPEGHDLWYSAVFFECKLSSHNVLPSHVSVVRAPCSKPANILKVRDTLQPERYPRRFTVCLTPLNTNYGRAYELVEWIELNRIMGAEKFVIYNHSISDNIATILDYYRGKHLVDIVQWRLPMNTDTKNGTKLPEIHYFGQIVALHDCLYRNKAESEFIVNIDLDEFIVPHDNNVSHWSDMIKQLPMEPGAYIFRSTFFRKEWENVYLSSKELVDKYRLITLQKLNHEEQIFPVRRRSKYFARTFDVRQVMIHGVQFLPTKKKAHSVPVEVGLLHHYRDWENEMSLPEIKVFDDTIPRKYSKTLIERVAKLWSILKDVKMDAVN
ncbi:uncharacterized protein LOC132726000 [Ruditapes philippinarum]|uniref:uncharacterized protein LOC132726000 n=1 Tax=Ruditapes philippinarum TaxID=129788 RepID=UPI00295B71B5|nr:uncharacterized protein LOC132726000 [Ruditapes philippinarum]